MTLVRAVSLAWRFLVAVACLGCEPSARPPAQPTPPAVAAAPAVRTPTSEPRGFGATVGFRSQRQLDDHVEKHGAEFGTRSARTYLQLAQALRDTIPGATILEVRRADGVVTRFDRTSGAFLAFNGDGTIRTFFKPNDGEQYFRRQARRRPGT